MSKFGIIWDLETIPDLPASKRMRGNPDMLASQQHEASDADVETMLRAKVAEKPHLASLLYS